jgi:hypothetical protein
MTPLLRMVAIIGGTLIVTKILTLAFARAEGVVLGRKATVEFLGWPGMRPSLFARRRVVDTRAAVEIAGKGARALVIGATLFVVARMIALSPLDHTIRQVTVTLIALPALSLMLHFGLFDLVAGFYRLRGVPVDKLFRAPLRARSLSEFWSRRWNVGFSEMIALIVHRPLRRNAGEHVALAGSFLASGLLHELAISVPVGAGYGLPTAYFLLHGALVAFERKMARPPGHLWTIFWLAAPMPLLFHPPFLRGVIWPLVGLQ